MLNTIHLKRYCKALFQRTLTLVCSIGNAALVLGHVDIGRVCLDDQVPVQIWKRLMLTLVNGSEVPEIAKAVE